MHLKFMSWTIVPLSDLCLKCPCDVAWCRWTLLDLTAGGSDRGPAMGGDGVVNRHSLPKVGNYFGPLLDEKKSKK